MHTSKAKELSPYEIIEKNVGSKQDPRVIYAALIKATAQPNYRILRHNNSLLFFRNDGNGTVDAMLFTADPQSKMVENVRQFTQALKLSGIKKLTMTIPNLKFIEFAKKAKLNYTVQNRGVNTFIVTVIL
jgi:hypothetical protein